MTVRELINELERFEDIADSEVFIDTIYANSADVIGANFLYDAFVAEDDNLCHLVFIEKGE